MNQQKQNKDFIVKYISAISGVTKTRELMEDNGDPGLVDTILFFDHVFPRYEYHIDEMLAEGDRVIVRARTKATHEAEFLGIPATHHKFIFPLWWGMKYRIEKSFTADSSPIT